MVGEWGGFGMFPDAVHTYNPGKCWGYRDKAANSTQLAAEVVVAVEYMQSLKALGLSVSVYTQTVDLEDECDGLLAYDRTAKFAPEEAAAVAAANAALIAVREWGVRGEGEGKRGLGTCSSPTSTPCPRFPSTARHKAARISAHAPVH